LGNPVAAPEDLPASYTPQGLKAAIQTAAGQAGVNLQKIEVEDSEFPFLVGVVCGESEYAKLIDRLKQMSDYADQGGVGSQRCHAMSITPYRAFPMDSGHQIERRLMLREQMFYDKLTSEE